MSETPKTCAECEHCQYDVHEGAWVCGLWPKFRPLISFGQQVQPWCPLPKKEDPR